MSKISMRKIIVGGREWKWGVGKLNVVARAEDNNEMRHIVFSKLTGYDFSTIDRAMWKRTFKITPKHIADWLKTSVHSIEIKI